MAFQPFGFPLEIRTRLSLAETKAAIRQRKRAWFDTGNGARGWIVGRFLCLWSSAFDRQGPMIFGWISDDAMGARITGRAGSDLNGLILNVLLLAGVAAIFFSAVARGGVWLGGHWVILGVMIGAAWLLLWWSHANRKDAQPLVRFLEHAVNAPGLMPHPHVELSRDLTLTVNGEELDMPLTADRIYRAVLDLGAGGFAILASADETYLMTEGETGGAFVLEWRDGDHLHHFGAEKDGRALLSFDDVVAAFLAYASGEAMSAELSWKKIAMPPRSDR